MNESATFTVILAPVCFGEAGRREGCRDDPLYYNHLIIPQPFNSNADSCSMRTTLKTHLTHIIIIEERTQVKNAFHCDDRDCEVSI